MCCFEGLVLQICQNCTHSENGIWRSPKRWHIISPLNWCNYFANWLVWMASFEKLMESTLKLCLHGTGPERFPNWTGPASIYVESFGTDPGVDIKLLGSGPVWILAIKSAATWCLLDVLRSIQHSWLAWSCLCHLKEFLLKNTVYQILQYNQLWFCIS